MTSIFPARLDRALLSVRHFSSDRPRIGIVLGSGLSGLAASFGGREIAFKDIEGFPEPTVVGHQGRLFLGPDVAVFAGRFHLYEGHSMDTVCLPVALLARIGVEILILTNAAGGIRNGFLPGDLVLISDHINMQGANPLVGPHLDGFGPRFSDMSEIYSAELRARVRKIDQKMAEGVYVAVSGPSYETPAEIRAFLSMGADLVGMSTVPEAILARSMGLSVIGISVVTNLAAGLGSTILDHSEVTAQGKKAQKRLADLLTSLVNQC